jgi:cell division protein FtsN
MTRLAIIVSLALVTVVSTAVWADDVAAERARLANDRIRAAEEQRIRDEAEQVEQAQVEQAQVERAQVERAQVERAQVEKPADSSASETPPAADRIEMSRALEQLRELGALKDAGYLTDEEFQLLKEKILEGTL